MKKENKIRIFIVLCLIIVLVSLILILKNIVFDSPIERRVYAINFEVGDTVGIDLNDTVLSFGRILPGTSSTRDFFIVNTYDFPINARVYASKNVANLLSFDENSIIMPMSERKVSITVSIPENFNYGNYTGEAVVSLYKQK